MSVHESLNSLQRARLTVDDFLVLDRTGTFDKYAKTELIGGEIYCVNAQFSRHAMAKTDLALELAAALKRIPGNLRVTIEVAVRIDEENLPEPDMIVTGFRGEGPVPCDLVQIAVEVSDTTLANDLGGKAGLYATARIAEYWVVDLGSRRVVRMWEPSDAGYTRRDELGFGSNLTSATIAGLAVDTREI